MITAVVLFVVATASSRGLRAHAPDRNAHLDGDRRAATRALLGLLAGFRWFNNPAFMGASAQRIPRLAADRLRRQARESGSRSPGSSILVGIGSLGVQGLNLGIDFKGGSQVTFKTPQAGTARATCALRRPTLGSAPTRSSRAAATSAERRLRSSRSAPSRSTPDEQTTCTRRPARRSSRRRRSASRTSPRASREQILRGAIIAIIVSLALIVALRDVAVRVASSPAGARRALPRHPASRSASTR